MEQRGRSADTVSCQPLSASGSLRESHSRSSTGQPKVWSCSLDIHLHFLTICVSAGVSTQVGPGQSNVLVSSPPNRPAPAQCCLLCHCGTLAGLHGHSQTDHHPIYSCTERRVRAPPVLTVCLLNVTLSQHLTLTRWSHLFVWGRNIFIEGKFTALTKKKKSYILAMSVVNSTRVSFTYFHIMESPRSEPQWVIVDGCFVCTCASQRAGAAKEELSHRHRQEEAGSRVCREYLRWRSYLLYVGPLIIVSRLRSPHFV